MLLTTEHEATTAAQRRQFFRRMALGIGALIGSSATRRLGAAEAQAGVAVMSGIRPGDPVLGEIITIPYNFVPRGFEFCEGQPLRISDNQSLFSLIGTYFGGDGRTTFQLPDTRAVEAAAKKSSRAPRPPFRYAIAVTGVYPSRA